MSQVNRWRFRIIALLAMTLAIWAASSQQQKLPAPHLGLALGFAAAWVGTLFMTTGVTWRRIAVIAGLLVSAIATFLDPGLSTMLVVSVGWAGAQIPWRRMRSLGVATVLFACVVTVLASGRVTDWATLLQIVRTAQFFNVVFLASVVLLLGRFATDNSVARREQGEALAELRQAHAELQRRAAAVEELATLRERARLSRELHDTLGHALSAITVQLEAVRRLMPQQPDQADGLLREAQEAARAAMRDLRVHLSELREPSAPEDLEAALRQIAASAATLNGWRIRVDVKDVAVSERGRKALFQVAKEALANCEHHAKAHQVLLRLEHDGTNATLTVDDDGCGFDPGKIARDHFGIAGMRERLAELGGELKVESSPGHGTRVTGTLPCRQAAQGGA